MYSLSQSNLLVQITEPPIALPVSPGYLPYLLPGNNVGRPVGLYKLDPMQSSQAWRESFPWSNCCGGVSYLPYLGAIYLNLT